MLLTLRNLYARVEQADDEELDWLRDYLSIPNPNARFTGGSSERHMFNDAARTFAAGFLPGVVKSAKIDGFTVGVFDKRTRPCEVDQEADLEWLRDYQLDSVRAIHEHSRGLLHLSTGAGKTEIAVGLARSLPCRWLALVHRAQLASDIAARFDRRNREHGVDLGPAGFIGEGQWSEGSRITCATFQTMARGLQSGREDVRQLLQRAEGLIVDEAHTLPAESFYGVAMGTPAAYFRVGLSGTPLARGDKRSALAVGALGPVITRVRAQTLVERGVLSKAHIRMVQVTQPQLAQDWAGVYSLAVVSSARRNAVVFDCMKQAAALGPSLTFVREVKHGRVLAKTASKAGYKVEFVYGTHSIKYRRSLISRLVSGHLDMLICSVVFHEGIDIPELAGLVIASGGKSVIEAIQRVGRGSRATEEKHDFTVWDIWDKGDDWLEKHAKERRNAYVKEGYETILEPESIVGQKVATGRPRRRIQKGSCPFCAPGDPCENCRLPGRA